MSDDTMRAVRLTRIAGPDALEVQDAPVPVSPDDVLIDVHAAGVAFADLLVTRGKYQIRQDPPFTPGAEVAGTVRTAPEASGFAPGDRVAAMARSGAWAEVAASQPSLTFAIPAGMSFQQAAAMPVNYQTSYFGLMWRGQLQPEETVLVHGAAGGVGSAAVQIARAAGARVIAVAQGEQKLAVARDAGAHETIAADSDWLSAVRSLTDGRGIDVVYDPVGGDRFTDSVRSLAPAGRLLVVGFAGGDIPTVAVNRLLLRNTAVVGVAWPEYARVDPSMPRTVAAGLAQMWATGAINPLVTSRYPLEGAADALRELDERRAIGKIVLVVREERGADG
jgi:NADPH2:quinone reductase